ncbi:MAG: hypothetical protein RI893_1423 [Pseudomonadota bacterium]|jgi:hypothetical protein
MATQLYNTFVRAALIAKKAQRARQQLLISDEFDIKLIKTKVKI